jgi:dihydroorotate dehydrogenase (fumarate)
LTTGGHPPPAYVESELTAFVKLLASHSSPTLLVGIKLPPYTYESQFTSVISSLSSVSSPGKESPISFLSSTNTLGQGLVFAPQIVEIEGNAVAQKKKPQEQFALPGGFGGLAGAAVHQISLG